MMQLHDTQDRFERVRACLAIGLGAGVNVQAFTADTQLLGMIPELDSLAIMNTLISMEEQFVFQIDGHEVSAADFKTLGSLQRLVERKLAQASS